MIFVEYRYTQDEEGYFHEILRNGKVSPRKFKKEQNLAGWVRSKRKLEVIGLLIAIVVVGGIISNFFGS